VIANIVGSEKRDVYKFDHPFTVEDTSFRRSMDTLGSASSVERAVSLAAPGARIGIFGANGEASKLSARQILSKELDVLGLLSSSGAWPGVFDLLSAGRIDPTRLVSQVFELEQLAEAFALKADPNNEKTKLVVRV
jgi:threonine dehydrogenase-like Zn-dependent dehydrogenase